MIYFYEEMWNNDSICDYANIDMDRDDLCELIFICRQK